MKNNSGNNDVKSTYCATLFGSFALLGVLIWRSLVTFKTAQWWIIWPSFVLSSAIIAWLYGHKIVDRKSTISLSEAFVRSILIFSLAIILSVYLSMFYESFELARNGDLFGGLLKLMLVLPYGIWNGVVAAIFSVWITIPLSLGCALILFPPGKSQNKL